MDKFKDIFVELVQLQTQYLTNVRKFQYAISLLNGPQSEQNLENVPIMEPSL